MSHVDFATNQDERSGFNGFPMAFVKDTTLTADGLISFPMELSRAEVVWAYWKVKTWRVYGDVHYTPPGNPTNDFSFDFHARLGDDAEANTVSTLTKETELGLPRTMDSNEELGTANDALVGVQMFSPNPIILAPYTDADLVIKFPLVIEIGSDAVGGRQISTKKTDFGSPLLMDNVSVEAHIPNYGDSGDAFTIPFWTTSIFTNQAAYTGSVIIEPFDYWPYT